MELAPEIDSCNRFATGACSLISNQFDMREQSFVVFARNRWCRRGSFAPGACCRSVLREQAASCEAAFRLGGVDGFCFKTKLRIFVFGNPLTPGAFYKKRVFWTFWRFSGWNSAKLALI